MSFDADCSDDSSCSNPATASEKTSEKTAESKTSTESLSNEAEIDSLQPQKSLRVDQKSDPAPKRRRRKPSAKSFKEDLVLLHPQGISAASAIGRPVLVLKDKDSGDVLPIWMQAQDANLAMGELSERSVSTSHSTASRVIKMLGGEVRRCIFRELIGHHQFADLVIANSEFNRSGVKINRIRTLRIRADEAMSFCLQIGTDFFATREFMARSREIDMDLAKLEYNLGEGLLPELKEELENSSRNHPYMM